MNRGVDSAVSAMSSAQQWLDVVTNNLANASTVAYKRDGMTFNDGLLRQMALSGGEGNYIGTLGSGMTVKSFYTDFTAGSIETTGNPLDFAINSPKGAFAVQTPNGIRFTRDGSFQLNNDRQLVDKQGNLVLSTSQQPIKIPTGELAIGTDGLIAVNGLSIDTLGVFEGTFVKEGNGLYTANDAQAGEVIAVTSGALESSNVNPIEEMVQMIRLNRAFEMAQKNVQSQDEGNERLISSMNSR